MTGRDRRAGGGSAFPGPHPAEAGQLDGAPTPHRRVVISTTHGRAAAPPPDPVVPADGTPALVCWTLPAVPGSVRQARRLVGEVVTRLGLPGSVRDDVRLLISELVTNAVLHGEGPVRIEVVVDSAITCRVADGLPALPRPRDAALDDETGRGLLLLDALTDDWGSECTADGKVVWFRLAFRGTTPPPG